MVVSEVVTFYFLWLFCFVQTITFVLFPDSVERQLSAQRLVLKCHASILRRYFFALQRDLQHKTSFSGRCMFWYCDYWYVVFDCDYWFIFMLWFIFQVSPLLGDTKEPWPHVYLWDMLCTYVVGQHFACRIHTGNVSGTGTIWG